MTVSLAASLASQPEAIRRKILADLSEADLAALEYDWRFWARPEQVAPGGEWLTWVINAGRGFGKTRAGAEWIRGQVEAGRRRIALVGETYKDLVEVMCFGDSGLASVFPEHQKPKIVANPNVQVTFHTGAIALGYNATQPAQLRGPQFDAAWCFVAGTMIETAAGPKPIENVRVGEMVWTRAGLRSVRGVSDRVAEVGEAAFSNGKKLGGTADHPLLTLHGWMRMDHLERGDLICAANVSNGAGRYGTATGADTTKGPGSGKASARRSDSIGRFMRTITGASLTAWTFITSMATRPITTSPILSPFPVPIISRSTAKKHRSLGRTCPSGASLSHVKIVARGSIGLSDERLYARPAQPVEETAHGIPREIAFNAGKNSCPEVRTYAASVVSTWRRLGRQRVFCLNVEGQPEYIANGILAHNCDELAKWRYARETWDMLQFGLRLGDRPQALVTTTPRPIAVLKEILADPATVVTRGSTFDNAGNLAPSFLRQIRKRYAGTRLGRQELEAEILDDLPGALWTRAMFDDARRDAAPDMRRIVVAVDPSGTSGDDDGDDIGIVVAGVGIDGRGYVLADRTCKLSPNAWARRAVAAYHEFKADRIVAERNYGGAMVEATIRTADRGVSYKEVVASRGKVVRAEPIAALYEQGRISHIGSFPELEDQLCQFGPDGHVGEGSPDRADALVWALTELMVDGSAYSWEGAI